MASKPVFKYFVFGGGSSLDQTLVSTPFATTTSPMFRNIRLQADAVINIGSKPSVIHLESQLMELTHADVLDNFNIRSEASALKKPPPIRLEIKNSVNSFHQAEFCFVD